jgi:hypothetical protein
MYETKSGKTYKFDLSSYAYVVVVTNAKDESENFIFGTFTSEEAANEFGTKECNGYTWKVQNLMRVMR